MWVRRSRDAEYAMTGTEILYMLLAVGLVGLLALAALGNNSGKWRQLRAWAISVIVLIALVVIVLF